MLTSPEVKNEKITFKKMPHLPLHLSSILFLIHVGLQYLAVYLPIFYISHILNHSCTVCGKIKVRKETAYFNLIKCGILTML